MPTGYTCRITENTTLTEWALLCARAFGATIEMKDDSLDAPIPDAFKPSSYHAEFLAAAQAKKAAIGALTADECAEAARKEHAEGCRSAADCRARKTARRAVLLHLHTLAADWMPPTPDHDGLKKFMCDQIDIELQETELGERDNDPVALTADEWRAKQLKSAAWDIDYHTKHQREEEEHIASRNEWIRRLRESLRTPKTALAEMIAAVDSVRPQS